MEKLDEIYYVSIHSNEEYDLNDKEDLNDVMYSDDGGENHNKPYKIEVKQNNIKSGSNSKINKTYEAMQVLEEKAIVQSFPFKQKSEDKEISPYFSNTITLKLSSIKIKREYNKQRKNGIILIKIFKDGKDIVRKCSNNHNNFYKRNRNEVKQNNSKSGSNSKINKTYEAMRVLGEKAIVQSFPFKQKSEDKEISPSLYINTSFTLYPWYLYI